MHGRTLTYTHTLFTYTHSRQHHSTALTLTSAHAAHTHVVGGNNLLFDGEIISLQGVQGRVPQDDIGVGLVLIFE